MKTQNMFEYATRNKLRFNFKGIMTVEDLWDLALFDLDKVFQALNAEVKQNQTESLMATPSTEDAELLTKLEIVKYIFKVKEAERDAAAAKREKAAQKQKLLEALAKKQEENLSNMSAEDLEAAIRALDEE